MPYKLFIRDDAGDITEMPGRVRAGSLNLVTHAEQGSVGSCSLEIVDTAGDFSIRGHRKVFLQEQDALTDPQRGVFYVGYTADVDIFRGVERTGISRTWTLNLVDLNTIFERRIMRGSDAKRPDETDVERAQWLEATSEMSLVDADTYLSTADPVDMDEADLRNQSVKQIWQDMSEQSGKNYFLINEDLGASDPTSGYTLWYGFDDPTEVTDLTSDIRISNYLSDIDVDAYEGQTVFPAALDTTVNRDPSRVYSGVVVEYDGGTVYRTLPATAADFALGGRDTTLNAPNVKTATKANARGDRFLASVNTEEYVVSTAIIVPSHLVNAVKAGYRIQFRLEHTPFPFYTWGRVLKCTVRDNVEEGWYELALEIGATPAPHPAEEPSPVLFDCNLAVTGGTRVAEDLSSPVAIAGEVWFYEITNSTHDPLAFTQDFTLRVGSVVIYTYSQPDPGPDQGGAAPYSTWVGASGTYVIPSSINVLENFNFFAHADYAPGTVGVNECYTVNLWKLA